MYSKEQLETLNAKELVQVQRDIAEILKDRPHDEVVAAIYETSKDMSKSSTRDRMLIESERKDKERGSFPLRYQEDISDKPTMDISFKSDDPVDVAFAALFQEPDEVVADNVLKFRQRLRDRLDEIDFHTLYPHDPKLQCTASSPSDLSALPHLKHIQDLAERAGVCYSINYESGSHSWYFVVNPADPGAAFVGDERVDFSDAMLDAIKHLESIVSTEG